VTVTAILRRVSDGVVRKYTADFDVSAEVVEFMFDAGNYSCDCNRALFFARAGDEDEPDVPCGDSAFVLDGLEY